ncbi:MAG: Salinibacter virus [Planctomycetota bacterium]|jgi:hypothetical protein
MKVVIAGSRSINNEELVFQAIEEASFEITEVISGGAKGVDRIGEAWAKNRNIPIRIMKPVWTHKGAGLARNAEMAEVADALIAVYDGESKGTKHMIETMEKKGKRVFTKICRHTNEP